MQLISLASHYTPTIYIHGVLIDYNEVLTPRINIVKTLDLDNIVQHSGFFPQDRKIRIKFNLFDVDYLRPEQVYDFLYGESTLIFDGKLYIVYVKTLNVSSTPCEMTVILKD